jgi:hypothetical protein
VVVLLGAQHRYQNGSEAEPAVDYGETIFSDVKFLNYPFKACPFASFKGRVSYIRAFSGIAGGYDTQGNGRHEGPLPAGVTSSDRFTAVTSRFGPPDEGGESSGAPVPSKWIIDRRLGLSFDFVRATGQLISVDVLEPKR